MRNYTSVKEILTTNRTKKGLISKLLLGIFIVTSYIAYLGDSHNVSFARADDGDDECKESKGGNTSTGDQEKNTDECNRIITDSEKCDSLTSMILSIHNIKCT
jgi:hypothetical protein